jgi:hypothetical protein
LLTVNETASEPPQEEGTSINSPRNLALEALFVNHNFSQQVLRMNEEAHKFAEANPFATEDEEGELASVGYRYRKWNLGNNVTLVSRCEHDAVMAGPNGELQYLNIKALNEWDSRVSLGNCYKVSKPNYDLIFSVFRRNRVETEIGHAARRSVGKRVEEQFVQVGQMDNPGSVGRLRPNQIRIRVPSTRP